jgi:hypothetical protein
VKTQVRIREVYSVIGTDGAYARGLSACNGHAPVVFLRFARGAEPRENVVRPVEPPKVIARPCAWARLVKWCTR